MIPTWILNNNETFKNEEYENSFFKYLVQQKKIILIALILNTAIFIALKFCFPIPDFFTDSFTYIADAILQRPVTYRPAGYADFLGLTHSISGNPNFTVFIQYMLFVTSTLFCFFSGDYLYGFPQKIKTIIFYVAILNPILILQTNLISSDSLFCSLTVIWFTFCLWIIRTHNLTAIILQVIFLLLCFHVRYTAVFYPVIATVAFLFSRRKLFYKIAGIILSVSVIYFYVERQKDVTERLTGTRVFSGFSGWQIANNVLCYYKEIDVDPESLPTQDAKIIDRIVKKQIDNMYVEHYVGTQYIWDIKSPLKFYLALRLKYTKSIYFAQWLWASQNMSDYGWAVIKQHPGAYVRYFMAPNFINYLLPDREILMNYNYDDLQIPPETKQWFDFHIDHIYCRFEYLQKDIIVLYPGISLLLNLVNIIIVFAFLFRYIRIWKKVGKDAKNLFIFWCFFYFGYVAFSVFSTIVLLRYLDPIFALGIIMPFILWQQIKRPLDSESEAPAASDLAKK